MILRLFILLALAALPQAGAAQCLLCDKTGQQGAAPSGPVDAPLRIEIAAQLDFSRVGAGPGGGAVTIDPRTGARRLSGNVQDLGGMALSGEAVVTGTPGRGVRIFVPASIELDSDHGARARVTDVATDLSAAPRLGPDGRLRFRFGGRLQVAAGDDGNYRGRIPISVEYE